MEEIDIGACRDQPVATADGRSREAVTFYDMDGDPLPFCHRDDWADQNETSGNTD